MDLKERIREAINCASAENGSDTPDFILAEYLTECLAAFDKATTARNAWYGPDLARKPLSDESPNAESEVSE